MQNDGVASIASGSCDRNSLGHPGQFDYNRAYLFIEVSEQLKGTWRSGLARYSRITGMNDVLFEDQPYWAHILDGVREVTRRFGYRRMDVPIMEVTSLFVRGVGEGTDIVEKEMYSFEDRDGTSISLRPEFTAGIMRAYIENGLRVLPSPLKVWTTGPLFRHEKPQSGRYRQHSQFDIEVIGESDPAVDAEVIGVAWALFTLLGFTGLRLHLNSTGCPECKPAYIARLVDYFTPLVDRLPEVDRMRLRKNPLRILDSKEKATQPLLQGAPHIVDHLCPDCAEHFRRLCSYLDTLERNYRIDYRIVRGLDYYTKTVFEIKADGLGAQDTICGGGRYDGLIQELGGPATPGIGFGSGIERIVLAMQQIGLSVPPEAKSQVLVAYRGEPAKLVAVKLVESLRQQGVNTLLAFGDRSLKAQMKSANRAEARYAVILGEAELETGQATVRDMAQSEQSEVPMESLLAWLLERLT